jgi:hypothetical protein
LSIRGPIPGDTHQFTCRVAKPKQQRHERMHKGSVLALKALPYECLELVAVGMTGTADHQVGVGPQWGSGVSRNSCGWKRDRHRGGRVCLSSQQILSFARAVRDTGPADSDELDGARRRNQARLFRMTTASKPMTASRHGDDDLQDEKRRSIAC